MASGRAVVDLRSVGLYNKGHFPNAESIPISLDVRAVRKDFKRYAGKDFPWSNYIQGPFAFTRKVPELDPDDEGLLFYDQEGGLAMQAIDHLVKVTPHRLRSEPLALKGGYQSWKAYSSHLYAMPRHWVVLCGKTGSGKTDVLQGLGKKGFAILDWEELCGHRGSVFGPTEHSNLAKDRVEMNLINFLRAVPEEVPLFVEQKGRHIGQFVIPDALWKRLRAAPRIDLYRSTDERVERILANYAVLSHESLTKGLAQLRPNLPGYLFKRLESLISVGDRPAFVRAILPYYDQSLGYREWPGPRIMQFDLGKCDSEQISSEIGKLFNISANNLKTNTLRK